IRDFLIRRDLGCTTSWMQDGAVYRVSPPFAIGWWWRTAHLTIDAQPPQQSSLWCRFRKLPFGGNPGVHDNQAVALALRQIGKQLLDRGFTTHAKPHAPHQAHSHAPNQGDTDGSGDDIAAHCAARTIPIAFA